MTQEQRRPFGGLTSEELDAIAERAASRALEHVYAEVGRSVLRKLAWAAGTIAIGLLIWLAGKDALPR
jgi:hypothetical protein